MASSQVRPFSLVHPEWELLRLSLRLRQPSEAGLGGVWAEARQGIMQSSARDRIATLLMWAKSEQLCLSRKPWNVFLSHNSGEDARFQDIKGPRTVPGAAEIQLSRIPCFNSQTRNAARINLFVRAIVPIPGSPGSPDSASISRGIFRFGRRLGTTSEGRPPNVALSAGGFSLQLGWFMISKRPGRP